MEQRATEAQREAHWDETVVGFIPRLRKLARIACVFDQAHSRKMCL